MLSRDYPSVMAIMENDALIIKAQMEHMLDDFEAIDRYVNNERQTLNQLKKTRGALSHEIRVITEVEKTTGSRIKPAPRSNNEQLIKGWLNHRTDSLLTKIYYLQRYLQASSRTTVLERFVVLASPEHRSTPFQTIGESSDQDDEPQEVVCIALFVFVALLSKKFSIGERRNQPLARQSNLRRGSRIMDSHAHVVKRLSVGDGDNGE